MEFGFWFIRSTVTLSGQPSSPDSRRTRRRWVPAAQMQPSSNAHLGQRYRYQGLFETPISAPEARKEVAARLGGLSPCLHAVMRRPRSTWQSAIPSLPFTGCSSPHIIVQPENHTKIGIDLSQIRADTAETVSPNELKSAVPSAGPTADSPFHGSLSTPIRSCADT